MKFTLSGFRRRPFFAVITIYTIFFVLGTAPYSKGGTTPPDREMILVEFAQGGVEEQLARDLIGSVETILKNEFFISTVSNNLLRKVEGGTRMLPKVDTDTIFSWKEKLIKAREYYRLFEMEKVRPELEDMIKAPYNYQLSLKGRELVKEALLLGSLVEFKGGAQEEGEKLVRHYQYLGGNISLPPELYPPDFLEFIRKASMGQGYATIMVNTTPPGSRVVVDGEKVGDSPVIYRILNPGYIKLEVRKEGFIGSDYSTVLLPGDRLNLNLDLQIDESSEMARGFNRNRYDEVVKSSKRLLERAGKGSLLAIALRGSGKIATMDILFVYGGYEGMEKGHLLIRNLQSKGKKMDVNDILPLLNDPQFMRYVPVEKRAKVLELLNQKEKITGKWWFWTLLGIGTAGLVYTIIRVNSGDSGGTVNLQF